jgi:archaeosortase B (VPXXXP-CTERM-specific)
MKKKHRKTSKEITQKDEKKEKAYKPILRFVLLFIGLLISFTILFSLTRDNLLYPFSEKLVFATAYVVGLVLNLFGMDAQVNWQFLNMKNFNVEIVVECTGLYEMFIFLLGMLAYPSSLKKKLWGALFGIPFIFLINIIRMVFIAVICNYRPDAFEFLHLYFWQVALILIILCTWILWIEKIVKSERF